MDRDLLSFLGGIIILVAVTTTVIYILSEANCSNKAKIMGMRYDYGFLQGCMIEYQPNKWVPLANYRVL